MKATLYKTTGETEEVSPANGTDFKLEELYKLIGTDIVEVVRLNDKDIMVIDEEGKLKSADYNQKATRIFKGPFVGGLPGDYIVGNAIVMDSEMLK